MLILFVAYDWYMALYAISSQAFLNSAKNSYVHTQTNDGLIIHNNRETTTGKKQQQQKTATNKKRFAFEKHIDEIVANALAATMCLRILCPIGNVYMESCFACFHSRAYFAREETSLQ